MNENTENNGASGGGVPPIPQRETQYPGVEPTSGVPPTTTTPTAPSGGSNGGGAWVQLLRSKRFWLYAVSIVVILSLMVAVTMTLKNHYLSGKPNPAGVIANSQATLEPEKDNPEDSTGYVAGMKKPKSDDMFNDLEDANDIYKRDYSHLSPELATDKLVSCFNRAKTNDDYDKILELGTQCFYSMYSQLPTIYGIASVGTMSPADSFSEWSNEANAKEHGMMVTHLFDTTGKHTADVTCSWDTTLMVCKPIDIKYTDYGESMRNKDVVYRVEQAVGKAVN